MKETLERPTVKDMIELLSKLDPVTPFRIQDADTDWTIEIVHVMTNDLGVWLHGHYHEMESGYEGPFS